ncbi:methionyl-tRNA synthetase [Enteropsectra breve]|nr:methionyl-tRNA synthetase [Enteropsectra breve]
MAKKFITAALPYVNNQPHLGNIVGSVLGGDVYSRYCRAKGDDVTYISGTDEYGTATEMEAMKQGIHPKEIIAKNRALHQAVYKWLNLNFDYFGNTDCPEHIEMTQQIFKMCYKNGYFEKKSIEQFYCDGCTQFLADRYIKAECGLCGYEDARGDQCDKCGRCLKDCDLKNPRCSLCSQEPRLKSVDHLFLRLDLLQGLVRSHFTDKKKNWTANARHIYEEWIKKDIHPRCMTRFLKYRWGVPVPLAGFEELVFYVWFDAPIGYFTFLSKARADWKSWVAGAEIVNFMGKDNVPFHSIIFPSMLLACSHPRANKAFDNKSNIISDINCDEMSNKENSKENYNSEAQALKNLSIKDTAVGDDSDIVLPVVDVINSTEYLTFNKEKFSKSRGVGIFGMDLVNKDLGCPDYWRFYLIKRRPETKDADFSVDEFISSISGELIANYGNLCNRTLKYLKKQRGGRVELSEAAADACDTQLLEQINAEFSEYKRLMDGINLRDGLAKALEISSIGNKYLQDLQGNKERLPRGFQISYSVVRFVGCILAPFIPAAYEKLCEMLEIEQEAIPERFEIIKSAEIRKEVVALFTPLSEAQLANLRSYIPIK